MCTECGRQFVEHLEALTRTEKRLFSLLYNLITCKVNADDNLKTIATKCNREVKSIGKLDLEVTSEEIDLDKLENVSLAICYDKKANEIKIIKQYNEHICLTINDIIKKMDEMLNRFG